jgi:8-oxo-dGTP diphosphatase
MLRGAVIVLLDTEERTLLLKRAKSSRFAPERWGFPGGKIEKDESPWNAARRETKEETELTVADATDLGRFDMVVAYLAREYEGTVKIDHEHTDWAWVGPAELKNYKLAPTVLDIYRKAVNHGK